MWHVLMNPKYDMELCTLMDKSYFYTFINLYEMNFHGIGFALQLIEETSWDLTWRGFPFSTCQHSSVTHIYVELFAYLLISMLKIMKVQEILNLLNN
jgi:hypothetical protein